MTLMTLISYLKPSLLPARKKSLGSVHLLIEASPKKKHKDRNKSHSSSSRRTESGNSNKVVSGDKGGSRYKSKVVDAIEVSPKSKHKDPSKSLGGSRKGGNKSTKVVSSDEGGSGYKITVVDVIISDADGSFLLLAARARRNRIAMQPSFSRPMSPDFPDDNASGFMAADAGIKNHSPMLTAKEMMVGDSASDTAGHTVAWQARKVQTVRLRMMLVT